MQGREQAGQEGGASAQEHTQAAHTTSECGACFGRSAVTWQDTHMPHSPLQFLWRQRQVCLAVSEADASILPCLGETPHLVAPSVCLAPPAAPPRTHRLQAQHPAHTSTHQHSFFGVGCEWTFMLVVKAWGLLLLLPLPLLPLLPLLLLLVIPPCSALMLPSQWQPNSPAHRMPSAPVH